MAIFYSEINDEVKKKLQEARDAATKVKQAAEAEESSSKERLRSEEGTRHSLTFYFILGFFILIVLGGVFVFFYNSFAVGWIIRLNESGLHDQAGKVPFLELDKVLSIIVSAFGTSLGFIIGYYFKNKDR